MDINKLIQKQKEKNKPKFMRDHEKYVEEITSKTICCFDNHPEDITEWVKKQIEKQQSFV